VTLGVERVGGGFEQPVLVAGSGDGSGRLFVLEKIGRIRLLDRSVFLDIANRVTAHPVFSYEREQGLLGLAFHPDFGRNRQFYVHYNDRQGNHVISRFLTGPDGRGDPASERILLRQDQPETNFNGGMLVFGRDGYLYIGLGTGGTKTELQSNAQNLGSLLGKILRIDVDKGDPYAIPPDNPFVGRPGARPEVWLYGLRNPWRFSFDRATGDLYIGSPGEFKREWVHLHPAGAPGGRNYGWPVLEGTLCWRQATCDARDLPPPILEYNTYEGGNCALIAGYVYRGQWWPRLQGAYLFGDFCGGRVWMAARDSAGRWHRTEGFRLGTLISSFGEDEAGEIYITDIRDGNIYRVTGAAR
jgi:glucose/arabinose dehydrogenase